MFRFFDRDYSTPQEVEVRTPAEAVADWMLAYGIDKQSEMLEGVRDRRDQFVMGLTLALTMDGPGVGAWTMLIVVLPWDSVAEFDLSVRRYPEKLQYLHGKWTRDTHTKA